LTSGSKSRVLVADDHPLVRRGLKLILDDTSDFTVVAEVADGAEAVQATLREDVDLAVLDVSMPRLTGLQAARELSVRAPSVNVLILSMHDNEQYFFEALRAGAAGYVLKSAAERDLVAACAAAVRGEPFVYAGAVRALIGAYLAQARSGDTETRELLTARESEVTKLVAEGRTNREIAALLAVGVKTVERHRANIFEKLGMHDRVALTRYAIRTGLIVP